MDGSHYSQDRSRGRATPRDSHERHGGGGRHSHAMMDHHQSNGGHHHSRGHREVGNRRSKDHDISLEDSIQDLFESVNEALGYFAHFVQEYDTDIQRINHYCHESITDAIWKAKARGPPPPRESHDGRGSGRRRGGESEHDREGQERRKPQSIHGSLGQLLSSMDTTIRAASEFRPSQRRPSRYKPDDVAGIQQHLLRAYGSLDRLYPVVVEKRSKMKPVMTELEMLGVSLRNHVDGGATDRGAGGGRRSDGRRDMGQRETGGQDDYGGDVNEPEEEWDGGQEPTQGEL
ncbi:MAG: hypothetical protein Q9169_002712 [Polycauliona sp. 2 TL-2023]